MKKLLLMLVFVAACGSKKDDAPAAKPAPTPETTPDQPKPPTGPMGPRKEPKPAAPAPAFDPAGDWVKVTASHAKPKPTDPDVFSIPKFEVLKADFDPNKIEGGTADLALDVSSLVSNNPRRDEDIKGSDYLDVDKFTTVTIHVDNVKKAAENHYTADATVNAHGLEKKMPVEFDVVQVNEQAIQIHGTHTFKRLDFGIGAPEGQDSVGSDVTIEMQLTIKKPA
jgi:polyisoprenoid-binding protein YceI